MIPPLRLTSSRSVPWRYDQAFSRYPQDLDRKSIAQKNQPSPFTRCGRHKDTIKPDLVAFGGNQSIDLRSSSVTSFRGVGELSLSHQFASGRLFEEDIGTSFSAPYITHLAARLLNIYKDASANLLRALLIAHASPTVESEILFEETKSREKRRSSGYGKVDEEALFRSLDDDLTIIAEAKIENKKYHFYEVPVPEEFWIGNRVRKISVSLAYTSNIRNTRLDYRTTRLSFQLAKAKSFEELEDFYQYKPKGTEEDFSNKEYETGRSITATDRSRGTLQSATWTFKRSREQIKWFIVVLRHDHSWAEGLCEKEEAYALVVNLRDKENEKAKLLTQVKTLLQAKVKAREKEKLRS